MTDQELAEYEQLNKELEEIAATAWDDKKANNNHAAQERKNNPDWVSNRAKALKDLSQDPTWLANQLVGAQKRKQGKWAESVDKANKKRGQNPEWRKAVALKNKKLAESANWKDKVKKGIIERNNDPEYKKKMVEVAEKRKNPVVSLKTNKIYDSQRDFKVETTNPHYYLKTWPDQYFQISQEGFARLKLITDPVEFHKQLLVEKQNYIDIAAAKKKLKNY